MLQIKPLEEAYKFGSFFSSLLSESDFEAKPSVLLLGQYSTGKTTFIKHLLGRDYPGIHIGPEPTTGAPSLPGPACDRCMHVLCTQQLDPSVFHDHPPADSPMSTSIQPYDLPSVIKFGKALGTLRHLLYAQPVSEPWLPHLSLWWPTRLHSTLGSIFMTDNAGSY